jgi:hypothetical protein
LKKITRGNIKRKRSVRKQATFTCFRKLCAIDVLRADPFHFSKLNMTFAKFDAVRVWKYSSRLPKAVVLLIYSPSIRYKICAVTNIAYITFLLYIRPAWQSLVYFHSFSAIFGISLSLCLKTKLNSTAMHKTAWIILIL